MTRLRKGLLLLVVVLMVVNMAIFLIGQLNYGDYPDPARVRVRVRVTGDWETYPTSKNPANGVSYSVHDSYEDAWIQEVNQKSGLVQVQTAESKITLVFKPPKVVLSRFKPPNITPLTFSCAKTIKGECDFAVPYLIYAGNILVEGVRWRFFNKRTENKITKIYVVSGPSDGYFPDGLVLSVVQIVKDRVSGREKEITGSIGLKFTLGSILGPVKKVKRGDHIPLELFNFYELNPYKANVMGIDMNIVALSILNTA